MYGIEHLIVEIQLYVEQMHSVHEQNREGHQQVDGEWITKCTAVGPGRVLLDEIRLMAMPVTTGLASSGSLMLMMSTAGAFQHRIFKWPLCSERFSYLSLFSHCSHGTPMCFLIAMCDMLLDQSP